jgi:hypothetical protein
MCARLPWSECRDCKNHHSNIVKRIEMFQVVKCGESTEVLSMLSWWWVVSDVKMLLSVYQSIQLVRKACRQTSRARARICLKIYFFPHKSKNWREKLGVWSVSCRTEQLTSACAKAWMRRSPTPGLGGADQSFGLPEAQILPRWTYLWGYVKNIVYDENILWSPPSKKPIETNLKCQLTT